MNILVVYDIAGRINSQMEIRQVRPGTIDDDRAICVLGNIVAGTERRAAYMRDAGRRRLSAQLTATCATTSISSMRSMPAR